MLVGTPLVVILQDLSSDGRFLGMALIIFTIPMSSMGLVMFPKMVDTCERLQTIRGSSTQQSVGSMVSTRSKKRGASAPGGIRITGLDSALTDATPLDGLEHLSPAALSALDLSPSGLDTSCHSACSRMSLFSLSKPKARNSC